MPKTYPPAVKEKFLSAARAARDAGKTWAEAVNAAQAAGYESGLNGLLQMLYKKNKRRKAAPKAAAAAVRLVRRNQATGEITPRKPGRPAKDWENGSLDASGKFIAGKPPKQVKRGRRKVVAAPPKRVVVVGKAPVSGLGQIETIIAREVQKRLAVAKDAAMRAFVEALGI